jgi:hypothetical protein
MGLAKARMEALGATGEAAEGMVKVTVGAQGQLTKVEFAPPGLSQAVRRILKAPRKEPLRAVHTRPRDVRRTHFRLASRLRCPAAAAADRPNQRKGTMSTEHPERAEISRRLSAWHYEWVERHGFDLDDPEATPEAIAEYERGARRIMGLDPETGLSLDAPPVRRRRRER